MDIKQIIWVCNGLDKKQLYASLTLELDFLESLLIKIVKDHLIKAKIP